MVPDPEWQEGVTVARAPRIAFRVAGSGPPLLLINGIAVSGRLWPGRFLERLASSFRLVAMDNRGTGSSDPASEPFAMADLADDAVAVLDECGLERAHVLGHSMGAVIAQVLAARAPERVGGLVLCSASPGQRMGVAPEPGVFASLPLPSPRPGPPRGPEAAREMFAAGCGPGFAERHPEVIDDLVARLGEPTEFSVIMLQVTAMAGYDLAEHLASLRAPTLVVHGTADRMIPVDNGRILAATISGAQLEVLDGVGHMVVAEAPERVAGAIEGFLAHADPRVR